MGTEEYIGHLTAVDQDGNKKVLYPRTKAEAVEGLFGGDNDVASDRSRAFGDGNTVGLLGYYITEIDANNLIITLSMKQDTTDTEGMKLTWVKGDRLSMVDTGTYHVNCAQIQAVIDGHKLQLDKLPFTTLTEIEGENYFLHSVVCPAKPLSGQIDLGKSSTAFGDANTINNRDSLAVGTQNTISPSAGWGYAMGKLNKVTGSTATAIGYNNTASGENATAQGMSTTASGPAAFSSGYATTASGQYSRASGVQSKATGRFSDASGTNTTASGDGAHATGNRSKATGETSSAHNYGTEAAGSNSFATGSSTKAIGNMSFSSGHKTVAQGEGSFAAGYESFASGRYGAAFGKNTTAGENALVAGQEAEASGRSSVAVGYKAKTVGESSAAFGRGVTAGNNSVTVVGQYNADDNADRSARFVVGVGTDAENPATGFRVMENGDADLNGHRMVQVAAGKADTDACNVKQMNDAIAAAIPSGSSGAVREFNSGLINSKEYTTPGSLAKFYILTVAYAGEVSTLTVDWMSIKTRGGYASYTVPIYLADEGACIGITFYATINADETVTFSSGMGKILHVCGYY